MTASPVPPTRENARSIARVTEKMVAAILLTTFIAGAGAAVAARRLTNKLLAAPPPIATLSAAADVPRLPADIDERLASAFRQDQIITLPRYADPFVDRHSFVAAAPPGVNFNNVPASVPPPTPGLLTRLVDWQRRYKESRQVGRTPPPRTTAYLHTELSPIGAVRIRGQQKIWVFIQPEKFSLPVSIGARFYDATLVGINAEGALFRTDAGENKLIEWSTGAEVDAVRENEDDNEHGDSAPITSQTADSALPDEEQTPHKPDAETSERKLNRGSDLDALQDAVRERYRRAGKPISYVAPPKFNRLVAPAFDFTSLARRADDVAIADDFIPPFVTESKRAPRPNRASQIVETEGRLANGGDRVMFVRAAFRQIDDQERERTIRKAEAPPAETFPTSPPSGGESAATIDPRSSLPIVAAGDHASSPGPQGSPATKPSAASSENNSANQFCDPSYVGEPITVETARPLVFNDLIRTINSSFKANIVLDSDVQNLPVSLTFIDAPWNQIVRTQLELNDLDVICTENNKLVQIAKRAKITQIQDQKRKAAPIVREVFKLRYLQPTAGGRTDLAGRVQSGASATIQSLDETIREILRAGGDTRGEFRRVPGRNEFLVAAPQEQLDDIRRVIERVDRPGYQVLIKALIYNVNEDRLRDVGSQLAVVVGNGSQTNLGGFTTLPNTPRDGSAGGGATGGAIGVSPPVAGRNPAGIPTPGRNFATPNGLEAGAPTGVFGATTIVGTAQFAYQLTLAQNRGVANVQSRPFGVVSDGDTFDLVSGVQIPVVTAALAGGAAFGVGQVQFIEASRIARITPQVAEIDEGRAGFVTLLIQLENNDVGSVLYNGLPGVNRQSLQTVLRLRNNETAVIGGLSTDAVQRNTTKVPGLGDIPGFGWLFKRRFDQESRNRLYFAISVDVIGQDQGVLSIAAPADATTAQPVPPPPQQRHLGGPETTQKGKRP